MQPFFCDIVTVRFLLLSSCLCFLLQLEESNNKNLGELENMRKEKDDLNNQIKTLKIGKAALNNQIKPVKIGKAALNNQIKALKIGKAAVKQPDQNTEVR